SIHRARYLALREGYRVARASRAMTRRSSGVPGEGDLVEGLLAESLRGAGDRAPAERAVKLDGGIVVGERPNHETAQAALGKIAPRRGEQPPSEPQPLKFRPQIQLVDLAVIGQAARAVAAVIGVAGDAVGKHQERDAAALADGGFPPCRAPAADQFLELGPGN